MSRLLPATLLVFACLFGASLQASVPSSSSSHNDIVERLAKATVDRYFQAKQNGVEGSVVRDNKGEKFDNARRTLKAYVLNSGLLEGRDLGDGILGGVLDEIVDEIISILNEIGDEILDLLNVGVPIVFDEKTRASLYSIRDSIDNLVIIMAVATAVFVAAVLAASCERVYLIRLGKQVVGGAAGPGGCIADNNNRIKS